MNTNENRARRRARWGVEKERERDERRGQRKPRRQSGGSFVTVMASTPGLQPPRLAPPSRLPANTRPTRAQLSRCRFTYTYNNTRVFPVGKILIPIESLSRNPDLKSSFEKKWIDILWNRERFNISSLLFLFPFSNLTSLFGIVL